MRKYLKILSIIALSFTLTFCTDEEEPLKKPTDLKFSMDINREPNSENNLAFHKGFIILAAFDFEGEREVGSEVYFSREFTSGLNVNLNELTEVPELDFEIPQGVYNRISISFETFDDYDQNCLVVEGIFTDADNSETPLKFEFNSSEYWEIVAEDYSGNSQIIIDADVSAVSKIELDPIYWFGTVTYSMFESAERININGKPTIIVNESINTNIYELVVARIDESTECVFN